MGIEMNEVHAAARLESVLNDNDDLSYAYRRDPLGAWVSLC